MKIKWTHIRPRTVKIQRPVTSRHFSHILQTHVWIIFTYFPDHN